MNDSGLERFLSAQEKTYNLALSEIRGGRKEGHWMWYIFPQLSGLGLSSLSKLYGIRGRAEALDYIQHPVLGSRLREITQSLLTLPDIPVIDIVGYPDNLKLQSCMTLFREIAPDTDLFQKALDKYYQGQPDKVSLELLRLA